MPGWGPQQTVKKGAKGTPAFIICLLATDAKYWVLQVSIFLAIINDTLKLQAKLSPDFLMLISSQQCYKWLNHYPTPSPLCRGYFPGDQFASHLHQVEQYSISNLCLAGTNTKSWTVFIADTYLWASFSVSWMLSTSVKPEVWKERDNNSMQHREVT